MTEECITLLTSFCEILFVVFGALSLILKVVLKRLILYIFILIPNLVMLYMRTSKEKKTNTTPSSLSKNKTRYFVNYI